MDIDASKLNHVKEFVVVAKLMKGRENETQSTLSKALRKFKEITARGLLTVFERSIESRI